MGISVLRGVGWVPEKVLVLVQRPQHKSTPDPVAAPKNISFGTIFIEFGDTKKCCTPGQRASQSCIAMFSKMAAEFEIFERRLGTSKVLV